MISLSAGGTRVNDVMKILTRYVLSHFLMIFFMWLFIFSAGGLLIAVSQLTVKNGVSPLLALRAVPFTLPSLMCFSLPAASLLGGTLFFAKMTGSNEMIALKAMGVPPWKALLPVWIALVFISCFAVWCSDLSFSWGQNGVMRLIASGAEEMILGQLASEGKFTDPQKNITLTANEVTKSGELKQVKFTANNPPLKGEAAGGRIEVETETEPPIVRIKLHGLLLDTSGATVMQNDTFTLVIPLDQFSVMGGSSHYHSIREVKGVLEKLRADEEKVRRQNAARTVFALVKGDFDTWQKPEWGERWDYEEYIKYQYNRANMTTNRSLSTGFTCFFFNWVGIPVAIWLNRSDYFSSFFVSFLPTIAIYYPLLMLGYSCAKEGLAPPEICWIGNIVLGVIGFCILKKIHRH